MISKNLEEAADRILSIDINGDSLAAMITEAVTPMLENVQTLIDELRDSYR